jgi:hypothetical protein
LSTICYPIEQIQWNEEDAETVTISNELPGDYADAERASEPHSDRYEPARAGRLAGHAADQSVPITQAIAIIALTAHALSEDRAKCLDAGCNEYETKLVDFPRLLVKIQALLA